MSELSCDTPFIGRNETHDLSRYRMFMYSCKVDMDIIFITYEYSMEYEH